jgi:carboxypeptidase PM20D1
MPEKETAMDILNKALVTLHDNPFPPKIEKPTAGMLEFLAPEMPFPQNMAFANPWLFKKLIFAKYEKSGAGNAVIRTTSVNTIYHAGIKDNVIPTLATAIINYRLLPSDASADIKKRVIELIGDERVVVSQYGTNLSEGSPAADPLGHGFQKVDEIIRKSYDSIVTSPLLLIAATDSRFFTEVSDHIIKFSPMTDPIGFHGIDERVSLESFRKTMWFFEQLMRDTK